METVVVGMSGGVDSSVTAYLLKNQGFKVIGLFMKNWEEETEEGCSSAGDYEDVRAVCELLDIPYYTVSFVKEYRERVFSDFLKEYAAGYTPNPDVLCNREIKFKLLLKKAVELGGRLATGHYCRKILIDGKPVLQRAFDSNKDQSYFLSVTSGKSFDNVLFPLGDLLKTEVRRIAEEARIPTAAKKDSTGICFIGKRNFKEFLGRYLVEKTGPVIEWTTGKYLGEHPGAHFFTIGQRKGLNVGGAGGPWYVVDKDMETNTVYAVGKGDEDALLSTGLSAQYVNWFFKPHMPFYCSAKVRYRSEDEPCRIEEGKNGSIKVTFLNPVKAVTPRQTVVFYSGNLCLGGGTIDSVTQLKSRKRVQYQ